MTQWKDILCLLAILVAYGLAGHLDYQDAVAMEAAMSDALKQRCTRPIGTKETHASQAQPNVTPARFISTAPEPQPACRSDE